MSNKRKIVVVISIISIMILCFSISTFAFDVDEVLEAGTILKFNDNIIFNSYTPSLKFSIDNVNYYGLNSSSNNLYYLRYQGDLPGLLVYTNDEWISNDYKVILLTQDFTINSVQSQNFFNSNVTVYNPPPHLEPSFWETVSGFFSEALTSGSAIVNWMKNTPIALIPLALYCLIVIIAITKRMIKG